ncbi:hypothetical protein EVAR_33237_1 [Eumeta japonica]|uniref:Uncharacterized protein n=1 Tax=Eumeta variegata TaxID=151549 RepID=A0A4C1W3J9_EUMVA|nr:hypothetical protein EVAR_33237_1 [Eumeta japonica]
MHYLCAAYSRRSGCGASASANTSIYQGLEPPAAADTGGRVRPGRFGPDPVLALRPRRAAAGHRAVLFTGFAHEAAPGAYLMMTAVRTSFPALHMRKDDKQHHYSLTF